MTLKSGGFMSENDLIGRIVGDNPIIVTVEEVPEVFGVGEDSYSCFCGEYSSCQRDCKFYLSESDPND